MVEEGSDWEGGGGLRRCAMLSCCKDSPTVVRLCVCISIGVGKSKVQNQSLKFQVVSAITARKKFAKPTNNTTFNVDHCRWGRARDAHNSRIMDQRSNNNKDRMVFGSL